MSFEREVNEIRVIVVKNKNECGKVVASLIQDFLRLKKKSVLGLATGETMIPVYLNLLELYKKRKVDFSGVKTFNLDEYLGFGIGDAGSFRSFMDSNLFNYLNLKKKNIHFLDGKAINASDECQRYEKEIKKTGGIDLQILGIGRDGHIGFNEPGSSIKSRTRRVKLKEITKKDNKKFFKSSRVPDNALTMGIANILEARKIVLVAFGKEKEKAIRKVLIGKITGDVPASFLRKHNDVTFVVGKSAAYKLPKISELLLNARKKKLK